MAQSRTGPSLPQTHRLALESLNALRGIRTKEGNWRDEELEQEATATQSYKRMEALLCFLSVAPFPAIWNQVEQDTKSWLSKDIKRFFELLVQDGFFASPYALVVEHKDQYVDFACDVLHFCCSIADTQPNEKVIKDAEEWSCKAMELVTKEGNFHRDDQNGCVWAPTTRAEPLKGVVPYSTYFTSLVILAIQRAVTHSKVRDWLGETQCKASIELAKQGCAYILAYIDEDVVLPGSNPGVSAKHVAPYEKLVCTCWGLRALLASWDLLEAAHRTRAKGLAKGYLKLLEEPLTSMTFYHQAISTTGAPVAYEHRTDLGGILTTLVEMKRSDGLKDITDEPGFIRTVDSVRRDLIAARDPESKLWYAEGISVSGMPSIITDLLLFGEYFGDLDTELHLRLSDLTTQVRKILEESDVLDTLAKIVTNGLADVMEHMEVNDIMDQMKGETLPDRPLAKKIQRRGGKPKKRRSK